MQYIRPAQYLPLLAALLCAAPAAAQGRGANWSEFKPGDRAELDVACSGHWEPVSILKIAPVAGRSDRDYTVRRADGSEWSFRAPGIVAPCGRAAGGSARESAGLPALPTGVYGCVYGGQPAPALEFALLSGSTYRDRDGGRGTYQVDPKTRVLTFVSGPMRGTRVRQTMATAVRVVREDGTDTGNVCAHNPKRDPNAPRL